MGGVTPLYWQEAVDDLADRCKVMRKLVRTYPHAKLRTRGSAFATLARAIVGQQISVKAAQSVWDRVATVAGKVSPERILDLDYAELRACGLSNGKVVYFKDLARHFHEGLISPRRWPRMHDEAVIEDLVRVRGIGRWSAEMFLLFYLMRPNIFPVGDLGLIRAVEKHFNKGLLLTRAEVQAYATRWHPWNSVATWYLWRSLDPIPVDY